METRKCISIALFCAAALTRTAAQNYRPIGQDGQNPRRLSLTLNAPPAGLPTGRVFRFSGVRVIDDRIDTTRISYVYDASPVLGKMGLSGDLSMELGAYLKKYYAFSPGGDSLLLFIRDFRLSCIVEDQWTIGAKRFFVRANVQLGLKRGDNVFLLGRYDTLALFGLKHKILASDCLSRTLYDILRKADTLAPGEPLSPRAHTDIYPILTETSLQKGAYGSFREMMDNHPSYTYTPRYPTIHNYEIIATDSSGAPVPNKKIWGYCDGSTIFVHADLPPLNNQDYFPLVRFKNSLVILPRDADYGYKPSVGDIVTSVIINVAAKGNAQPAAPRTPPVYLLSSEGKQYLVWGTEINLKTGELQF